MQVNLPRPEFNSPSQTTKRFQGGPSKELENESLSCHLLPCLTPSRSHRPHSESSTSAVPSCQPEVGTSCSNEFSAGHRTQKTPRSAMKRVAHVQLTPSQHSERCGTQPGERTHLVGSSDEPEDVHLGVRLHVVTEQGVQVRDGGQRAVFIGHAVQVPGRGNEPDVTGRLSWNSPISVPHAFPANSDCANKRLEFS